jgi:hypothetical protein
MMVTVTRPGSDSTSSAWTFSSRNPRRFAIGDASTGTGAAILDELIRPVVTATGDTETEVALLWRWRTRSAMTLYRSYYPQSPPGSLSEPMKPRESR